MKRPAGSPADRPFRPIQTATSPAAPSRFEPQLNPVHHSRLKRKKVMAAQSLGTAKRGVLLERSEQLSALAEQLAAVSATSHGRLVLVGGEAGAGKTALVRRFAE